MNIFGNINVRQPERVLLREQIQSLAPSNPGKTLDVGGGNGYRYRGYFNTNDFQSLDLNPELKPDILASADKIPLPGNTIDTILSSQMLEHVVNPLDCLKEMIRVLKPGGSLIITIPQSNEMHSEPDDYWRFTKFGIVFLLEQAGFKVETVLQRGNYPSCIAQMRIKRLIDSKSVYLNKGWLYPIWFYSLFYSRLAIWMDSIYISYGSKKNALGWSILAKKPLALVIES